MNRKKGILRLLISPLALFYGFATGLRNMLFDFKILPSEKFPLPVICVGNLSAGGTGKTPFTEYIVALILKHHFRVATLSRGYKRRTKGFRIVEIGSYADEVGDEPCQLKQKYPDAIIAVDANRRRGINKLLALPKNERPQVIILDDAMQHRYVTPSLTIMLTDFNNIYYQDYMLPVGDLREAAHNDCRADIVVVTKCSKLLKPTDKHIIEKKIHLSANQRLYFSETTYLPPTPVIFSECEKEKANAVKQSHYGAVDCFVPRNDGSDVPRNDASVVSRDDVLVVSRNDASVVSRNDASILLVAGIANPTPFVEHIKTLSSNVIVRTFSDHHFFTNNDVRKLNEEFQLLPPDNRLIICTEKDAMRLKTIESLPIEWKKCLYYIPITTCFLFDKGADFDKLILKHILSTININK